MCVQLVVAVVWMLLGSVTPASSPASANVSSEAGLNKALLASSVSTIYVQSSFTLTATITIGRSIALLGVLQADGSLPVLDCGGRVIQALIITSGGRMTNLQFSHCHDTAVWVLPSGPKKSLQFTNLTFRENYATNTSGLRAGALLFETSRFAVTATLTNCSFINNGAAKNASVGFSGISALAACFGVYTLQDCTFLGNGAYLSDTASSVVAFYWLLSSSDDASGDYFGHFADYELESGTDYDSYGDATTPVQVGQSMSLVVDRLTFVNNSAPATALISWSTALFLVVHFFNDASLKCKVSLLNSKVADNNGGTPFSVKGFQNVQNGCDTVVVNTSITNNRRGALTTHHAASNTGGPRTGIGMSASSSVRVQGPVPILGGALYLSGQNSVLLERVVVAFNNLGFVSVVWIGGTTNDVTLQNCTFSGNSATQAGVTITETYGDRALIVNCVFFNNSLKSASLQLGGAALFVESINSLQVLNCNFTTNTGGVYGGALYVKAGMLTILIQDTVFESNSASLGGGAVYYGQPDKFYGFPALFQRCTFHYNTALYGGAAFLNQADAVTWEDCLFEGNTARSGGAVTISNNNANQFFLNCTFNRNRAEVLNVGEAQELQGLLWQNACGPGGGGALCSAASGQDGSRITLTGCTMVNNMATYGGAVFLRAGTACTVSSVVANGQACYQLDLLYCSLINNTADQGAGGALYLQNDNIANILCSEELGGWIEDLAPSMTLPANASDWDNYTDYVTYYQLIPVATKPSFKQLPCLTWVGNVALRGGYGPIVATPPRNVTLTSPVSISSFISQGFVPVILRVVDWYEQLVTSNEVYSSVVTTVSTTSGNMSEVYDHVVTTSESGFIDMTNLRLQAVPGWHNITIATTLTLPFVETLTLFTIGVHVDACPVNYMTTAAADAMCPSCIQCTKCIAGQYNIINGSSTCLPCPPNAICSDPNIGGGVIVPMPGFWSSHPFSTEMHPCYNVDACTSRNRSRLLATAQEAFVNATQLKVNSSTLQGLLYKHQLQMCGSAYQGGGVLCGACTNGYGHVATVTCTKCRARRTVIAVHVLMLMVTLVLVSLTIRSSLLSASGQRAGVVLPFGTTSSSRTFSVASSGLLLASRRLRITASSAASGRLPGSWLLAMQSSTAPTSMAGIPDTAAASAYAYADSSGLPSSVPEETGDLELYDEDFSHRKPTGLSGALTHSGTTPCVELTALDIPSIEASGPLGGRGDSEDGNGSPCGGASVGRGMSGYIPTSFRRNLTDLHVCCTSPSAECGHQDSTLPGHSFNEVEAGAVETAERGPQHMTIILILVSYLQVLGLPRRIPLLWPQLLVQMFSVCSMATSAASSLASFECFLNQGERVMQILQISILQISEPMAILALLVAFWVLWVCVKSYRGTLQVPMMWYLKRRLVLSSCVLVFYVYPGVTDMIISSFACQRVDSAAGQEHLQALGYEVLPGSVGLYWLEELNQRCYSGQHWIQLWVIGVPGLALFAIGVPASCMYWLWSHRFVLEERPFRAVWGFLYDDYQPNSFYWEVMVETRKLGVIAVVSLISNTRPGDQLQLSMGIIIAALLAQVLVQPYKEASMNRLEGLSLLALALTFFMLSFFVVNGSTSSALQTTLSILIAAINAGLVLYMLYCLGLEVLRDLRARHHMEGSTTASFSRMLTRSARTIMGSFEGLGRLRSARAAPAISPPDAPTLQRDESGKPVGSVSMVISPRRNLPW